MQQLANPQSLAKRPCHARAFRTSVSRQRVAVVKAAKTADGPTIAIVGVTGAVGQEFLTVIKERNFPYKDIKMLASARSAGQKQEFEGHTYTIEELTENSFKGVDIALFSAGGSISKTLGPVAAAAGAVYAFNLFSHNSSMMVDIGYNEEEMKLVKETRKIWGTDAVRITATCVRVPVMRAHAESINLEFEKDITEEQALEALANFPGVSIINDRQANRFPTPLDATTKDNVFVGRVRRDISRDDKKGLDLFVCGDQIKKGAALNAVQIAELLLKH